MSEKGSPVKRRAVIDAARDLFVRHGVDRVTMDAVAAQAKVSKATVYEYYGDKRRLFLAILADASESMMAVVRRAFDEHLPGDGAITTVDELETALTAFALDIGPRLVGSIEYAAAFALVAQRRWQGPSFSDDIADEAMADLLAEHLGRFAATGLLDTSDPRLAATHFSALTILLAFSEEPDPANADLDRIRRMMSDGVHAFMRAYGKR